jgi:hypothetical protein
MREDPVELLDGKPFDRAHWLAERTGSAGQGGSDADFDGLDFAVAGALVQVLYARVSAIEDRLRRRLVELENSRSRGRRARSGCSRASSSTTTARSRAGASGCATFRSRSGAL